MTPVQSTGKVLASPGNSVTCTLNGVTAGNLLVLTVGVAQAGTTAALAAPAGWSTAEAPTGFTFSGDGFSQVVAIFYKENATAGTNSPTVSASSSYFTACLSEWAITGTGNLDVHTNNGATTGTSGNTGTTGTTAQTDELVIAVISADNGNNTTNLSTPASSGYTSLAAQTDDAADDPAEMSYKTLSATGTQIASWTWTNSSAYSAAIATFKISGGGAVAASTSTYLLMGV